MHGDEKSSRKPTPADVDVHLGDVKLNRGARRLQESGRKISMRRPEGSLRVQVVEPPMRDVKRNPKSRIAEN